MKINFYPPLFIHEIGHRDNQEDYFWPQEITVDNPIYIVCDGMGGHEKGEIASETICKALGEWFSLHVKHPFSKDQMSEAMSYAYEKLDKKDTGDLKKMGTTLTLLYFDSNGATAAHVGDSRIYHIRPNTGTSEDILYLSRDHSLVYDLFQSGEILYDEMSTHPQKNVITRAVTPGKENRTTPDMVTITDIKPGDYFYMCSDGMLEQMSNDELAAILATDASDEKKCQKLLAETVDNQDNHTAWLLHVKSVMLEQGDSNLVNEEPNSRCNAINIIRQRLAEEIDCAQVAEEDVDVIGSTHESESHVDEKTQDEKPNKVFLIKSIPTKSHFYSKRTEDKSLFSYVKIAILALLSVMIIFIGASYLLRNCGERLNKTEKVMIKKR